MGDVRNEYKILVGKPKRKGLFGGPGRRWEDTIRIDVREIGWGGVDWIHLAEDRDQLRAFVNTVTNIRVSQNPGNFLTI
jgi:hypothetical protein